MLDAKDYGIPQHRERVFVISIKRFEYPKKEELKLRLKDMLEDNVDEKYYLSEKMLNYITSEDDKYIVNKDLLVINRDIACSKTTREGNTRADTSDYVAKPYEKTIDIKQVGQMYGTEREPNPQTGRIYDSEGISPAMDSCSGGNRMPKILIKNATKQGYDIATIGDSVNLQQPNSETRRARVGEQISNTLQTTNSMGVVVTGNYMPSGHEASRIVDSEGLAPTVKENHGTVTATNQDLRIRKLTPKECWRLMGFTDEEFEKAKQVNSNAQLYKQAGNSIVVNVLEKILMNLLGGVNV